MESGKSSGKYSVEVGIVKSSLQVFKVSLGKPGTQIMLESQILFLRKSRSSGVW